MNLIKKMLLHFNALSVTIMKFYLPFPRTFSLSEILLEQADQLNHWHSTKAAKEQRRISSMDIHELGYTNTPGPFCYGFVGLFLFWYAAEPVKVQRSG